MPISAHLGKVRIVNKRVFAVEFTLEISENEISGIDFSAHLEKWTSIFPFPS